MWGHVTPVNARDKEEGGQKVVTRIQVQPGKKS